MFLIIFIWRCDHQSDRGVDYKEFYYIIKLFYYILLNCPDGEMDIDNDQEINVHNMQEKSSSHYPLGRLTDIVTDVLCLCLSDQRRINLYRILIDSQ